MTTDWVEVAHDPQAAAAEIDRLRKLEFWSLLGSSTIRNYGHLEPQEALEAMIQDAVADRTTEMEQQLTDMTALYHTNKRCECGDDEACQYVRRIQELERQLSRYQGGVEMLFKVTGVLWNETLWFLPEISVPVDWKDKNVRVIVLPEERIVDTNKTMNEVK